ncbi:alpha/beta hydrolase [Pontivivens ytuae]|uniref:Alpha/beta hydrolase n=1 Tax=Pontivivens ytuae TaxID=2789856 RepID=A0A7S9LNI9_9RHOB|nr:alpha/beta hydrolase [Pontivivens ytuae]QPH52364.1 hypothetical protein I0K15_11050 [Pontivivens ytuae]
MKWLLAALAVIWLAAAGWFTVSQRDLFYPFDTADYPASVAGPGVRIRDLDGLQVWFRPPDRDLPVILYFIGNTGNPARQAPLLQEYTVNGFGLVTLRYRQESASEEQLISDALHVARSLEEIMGAPVPPERLVIHGVSLGSGIATAVALEVEAAGLIVETPFTRLCDVPSAHVPGLPYCLLAPRNRFATVERIGALDMPLLVQHGTADSLVPYHMGEAVFAAAPQPKRFLTYEDGDHNDLRLYGAGIDARAFAVEVTH